MNERYQRRTLNGFSLAIDALLSKILTLSTNLPESRIRELHEVNPKVIVVIEVSIKGTNPEEFKLIADPQGRLTTTLRESDVIYKEFFEYNIQAYYNLKKLQAPNLRPTVIAGYGISESLLLTEGRKAKSRMTILFNENTPIYHPSLWSTEFKALYEDFINDWKGFDNMFSKMPMYGIKDQFNYGWVKAALKQAKCIYKWRFYDATYVSNRNLEVEKKFCDILEKFTLKSNQEYYSTLIRR